MTASAYDHYVPRVPFYGTLTALGGLAAASLATGLLSAVVSGRIPGTPGNLALAGAAALFVAAVVAFGAAALAVKVTYFPAPGAGLTLDDIERELAWLDARYKEDAAQEGGW